MTEKSRVLSLCTHNSARRQMAEGFLRHLARDRFEAYSAGIGPMDGFAAYPAVGVAYTAGGAGAGRDK